MTYRAPLLLVASAILFSPPARADAPADTPPAESWACSSESMEDALRSAEKGLVRVEGRLDSAVGFVFHSPYHVLTTFSAVFWGECLSVRLPDGRLSPVRVVAHDSEADLAVIELDRPVKIEPLELGPDVRVGDPVYAVGFTSFYDGDASIHAGVVNSTGTNRFNTDALDGSFHKLGGPILDCTGKLVGIAGEAWGQKAIPIERAVALTEQIGKEPIYEGPVVTPRVEVGGILQADPFAVGGGVAVGVGITGLDGWEINWQGGMVLLGELEGEQKTGLRVFGQTLAGYRLWLDDRRDYSLNLGAGLTIAYEQFCQDQCSDVNPPVLQKTRFLPTLDMGFQFFPGTFSYQYQLDVDTPDMSIHQIMLGIEL